MKSPSAKASCTISFTELDAPPLTDFQQDTETDLGAPPKLKPWDDDVLFDQYEGYEYLLESPMVK